ncbi:MAG: hypothetical protein WC330_03365, partial [Candidatus Omnitrophota bacterium]
MRKRNLFQFADAWLLLAIIYASQKTRIASLTEIIAYGDFINHAIFTWQELQGGLFRLIKSGYIIESENGYKVSSKIFDSYKKFAKKNGSIFKQLGFIQQELSSPEWSEDYNPLTANKG